MNSKRQKIQTITRKKARFDGGSSTASFPSHKNMELIFGELIIMSGFLFHYDCKGFGLASKHTNDIWNVAKPKLPLACRMEILPINKMARPLPSWCTVDLERILNSHEFIRQIFLKVCERQEQENSPSFDYFDIVQVSVFNGNQRYPSGMHIGIGRARSQYSWAGYGSIKYLSENEWSCRLHPNFAIMSGIGASARKIYESEGSPSLWS